MTTLIYQNFIHGAFVANKSKETFPVINPATDEVMYHVEVADEYIQRQAIGSAQQGFAQWSAMTPVERSRILNKAVYLLRERNEELAKIEVLDTGKPIQEADCVDIQTGADVIEYFAGLAPTQMGAQQPVGDDFFYTRKEPLGICAGIGAWNYPLQIACWKSGPALAAGNALIFKPSEETPLGAIKLAEIFIEAGMPAGVFNVVQGAANVGQWLTTHPDIEKVSFTGEVGTGKKVMQSAASNLKEVTMELGGKSPLIVFDDADITEAVSAAMLGNFYTQGEICTNCTRVYVHKDIYQAFLTELKTRTEQNIIAGDPLDPKVNLGALISKQHQKLVLDYIEQGKNEGAKLLTGGHALTPESAPNGYFVAPTIFVDCTDDMTIVKEEIFGPVMSVLVFEDEDEVIARANDTELGLGAGVFSLNIQRAHRVIHQLKAGICWINSYGNSPAEMPVGGYQQSGIGRENGVETLNSYTQTKSVYVGMSKIESPF
ncbi:betaine-aldehyde dehydrogenase [Pseudoalteromonas luteoviolacea]|uniref:Betaine-aldehyde dehydrogenase n=1 Tax=Pseudoalteromonas luteoviolacea H33 TaxID=1365251 RepID=A0A167D7A6_9GAMM|nr:betaine-aldehyde dehydrogenase [Pseudoalteromonas luteoviolacea]KZN48501.1 4-trimethylaminobutyraldehyde dehydrogenase [Pseudoalteromonas luteoviolacea H33]KZN73362.1 4-trimethylaminobutyraldehyde dehydrogenase [Pseudoalteromonas luteoviolacea H33-S]MBQ4876529.1 betaine-aldehyde dehydrogenase [Pseudoalteromonas luteoviolacea]MBQ4905160.1 betaine-aldehyde dehydrogenase [Pseudoalteromonas luteoviolacea]